MPPAERTPRRALPATSASADHRDRRAQPGTQHDQAKAPTAVVVLAAGAGTRMRSKTPKVLHALGGRSMLAHALYAADEIDPAHLITVIGHDREQVGAAVSSIGSALGRTITTTVQEHQLGTGHAVQCALEVLPASFDGDIVVTAGDVPLLDGHTLASLLAEHRSYPQGSAVTVLTFEPADPNGYGRIVRDHDGALLEIVEHADATPEQVAITEVNSGVYAFDATVLREMIGRLSTANAQYELYLTDVLKLSREAGYGVHGARLVDEAKVTGVNDRVQLANAGRTLNTYILERHMRAGVTIVDPATTWIDASVRVARDVVIKPGVQLYGDTVIGEDAVIGPDSTLTDVLVGAGATVVRAHGDSAEIGEGATIGPFTYLRPGTVVRTAGKLGAFVETKNADIGAHTKVPHLTYVGDATIGEHTNIGASSVFVNYDGVQKRRTVVGSHVRTGSDNMFVAPVEVGDGAYTGAGTVLRHDVPPGALAVSGSPQRNIEGWVQRKRPGSDSARAADEALNKKVVTAAPGNDTPETAPTSQPQSDPVTAEPAAEKETHQ